MIKSTLKCIMALLLAVCALPALAQVNGEYRSAVATGVWSTAATWETYSTTTSTWSVASAVPSGITAIVTVRNGHTIQLTGNISYKKLTIDAGGSVISDASERRMDFAADTSFLIVNGNLGGASASNNEKLGLANNPACKIATISGSGTISVARIRFNTSSATVTQSGTLVIDANMTVTSSGITGFYNNGSNTAAENDTITINAGRTVTMGGSLHSPGAATSANTGGNYTYNINGTLDASATSTITQLYPTTNGSSTVTINVSGVWKVNNVNAAYVGTNTGNVVLNILNGGLIDASRSANFNMGSKYFFVSGTGKLKRAVPATATTGVVFPIGTSSTAYNPLTLTATSADDTFAVNVSNTLSYAIGDPTKIVTKQWDITPTGTGAGVNPTFGWVTADQAAGFSQSVPMRIFRYSAGPPAGWVPIAPTTAITGSGTVAAPYMTGPNATPAALSGLYVVGDSIAAVIVVPTVSISASPGTTICAGTPVTFTATTTNITGTHYQWKRNGTNAGTDSLKWTTATLANGDTVTCSISYTASGPVAATSTKLTMTVNPLPNAGTLSGPGTVCSGTTGTLTSTVSGGTWSSGNTAVATVSSAGVVSGLTVGTAIITYSYTNSCGTATATKSISVTLGATAGTLSGTATVCPNATTTFVSTASGGVWATSNSSVATVSQTGVVTGVAGGTASISYIIVNGCGTDTARRTVTVNPAPDAGTISGPSVVCTGSTITLSSTSSGGAWTSSNANATVTSGGVVSGVTTGTSVITYTVTNSCGSAAKTATITISTVPTVKSVTGPSSVCPGTTITLADSTTGGTWTSGSANATVTSTGVVTGVTAGQAVITYTVANSCGSASATKSVTVNPTPVAAKVTGIDTICINRNFTFRADNPDGIWTTTTRKAAIATDGLITGLSEGLDTVVYSVTNACGTAKTYHAIWVSNCFAAGAGSVSANNLIAAVAPNPSNGDFIISVSSATPEELKIIITNMLGEIVATQAARTNERVSMHLQQPAGIYMIHAVTAHGSASLKLNISK